MKVHICGDIIFVTLYTQRPVPVNPHSRGEQFTAERSPEVRTYLVYLKIVAGCFSYRQAAGGDIHQVCYVKHTLSWTPVLCNESSWCKHTANWTPVLRNGHCWSKHTANWTTVLRNGHCWSKHTTNWTPVIRNGPCWSKHLFCWPQSPVTNLAGPSTRLLRPQSPASHLPNVKFCRRRILPVRLRLRQVREIVCGL
jgi:hypothetical protein